jgi:hypothetical protein
LRIRWQNYRGYKDTGWQELLPLSLLIGANNAGKTSLYSPLLLLKQTLETAKPSTALLTRGSMFDAGRFIDMVRGHDQGNAVTLSIDFEQSTQGDNRPRMLELVFGAGDQLGIQTQLERYRVFGQKDQVLLRRQRLSDGSFGLDSVLLPSEKKIGRPPGPVSQLRNAFREEAPTNFLFPGTSGLASVGELQLTTNEHRERVETWLNAGIRLFQVQREIQFATAALLEQISYIGPLRALPKRTYQLSAEAPANVGTEGQYAPEILYRDSTEGPGSIVEGVNHFLSTCGYGKLHFETVGDGDAFHLLIGKDRTEAVNVADCGMGLSQLLPMVTESLRVSQRSLLIMQQPEIHLNPALQVHLTDHIVRRVAEGFRVLIETHSEHVLLRLRRLMAEGTLGSRRIGLYYVDKEAGNSKLRRISISDRGSIERNEWPQGFFAEQMTDSVQMARAQARAAATASAARAARNKKSTG